MKKNDLRDNINEMKKQIAEMESKIEKLEKRDSGWGDGLTRYSMENPMYLINGNGAVVETACDTESLIRATNLFTTKEKAEDIAFKQLLWRKLQKFADENSDGCGGLYEITYYHGGVVETQIPITSTYMGAIAFPSRAIAQKAINLFHDDLIKYFTK